MFLVPNKAFAEPEAGLKHPRLVGVKECSGSLYRPKKDNIPVYDSSDLSSRVIEKLMLGQRVCYVGEQGEFAILAWDRDLKEKNEFERIAFVRRAELWAEPGSGQSTTAPGIIGIFQKAKRSFMQMLNGNVPDDPLAPYRPLTGSSPEIKPLEHDDPGNSAPIGIDSPS